MEYRTRATSGLRVSAVALGTMTFGGDMAVRGVGVNYWRARRIGVKVFG